MKNKFQALQFVLLAGCISPSFVLSMDLDPLVAACGNHASYDVTTQEEIDAWDVCMAERPPLGETGSELRQRLFFDQNNFENIHPIIEQFKKVKTGNIFASVLDPDLNEYVGLSDEDMGALMVAKQSYFYHDATSRQTRRHLLNLLQLQRKHQNNELIMNVVEPVYWLLHLQLRDIKNKKIISVE